MITACLGAIAGSPPVIRPLPASFNRILVVRPHNQLGDMLCATPLLRALRRKYPAASITLITSPLNHDVMVGLRYLDSVVCFDKRQFLRGGPSGIVRLVKFIRALRSPAYDLAIVPSTVSTSFTSDLLARLSGAGVRIGPSSLNGIDNPSAFLYNIPVHLDWRDTPTRHQTLRNSDIAQSLDIVTSDLSHEMTLREDEIRDARTWANEHSAGRNCRIAIHPGAGKPPNRWPAVAFARIAGTLARDYDARIFITAGPMDDETIERLRPELDLDAVWIRNEPIRTVAAKLQQMHLVISNDTGIMHVAAAVGTPVLSLFGPTDPEQWAPRNLKNRYICGKGGRIDTITGEDVLRVSREMLEET